MLLFALDGTDYEFDENKLALSEAIIIKETVGLTVKGFHEGLQEMDPVALQALVWLSKRRAGEAVRIQDIEFDIVAMAMTIRQRSTQDEVQNPDPPMGLPTSNGSPVGMSLVVAAPSISGISPTT